MRMLINQIETRWNSEVENPTFKIEYTYSSSSSGHRPTLPFHLNTTFPSGSCHKRQKAQAQRRKRQSVTAKREKSQTPKILTSILTLPNLT